jgi:hypothetical protein
MHSFIFRASAFRAVCGLLPAFALWIVSGCARDVRSTDAEVGRVGSENASRAAQGGPALTLGSGDMNNASGDTTRNAVWFVDAAARSGLRYKWSLPRPYTVLQSMGYGCAFLDYDGDGNLDALLVGLKPALYKGNGRGQFADVSEKTGLKSLSGYFLGCAVGDYDNDGRDDVYLSGHRTGVLLHNVDGKRFENVTLRAGLKNQPFGTSCAFSDVNRDGKLDLLVGNYVKFDSTTNPQRCPNKTVETACGPLAYEPEKGVLYINQGNGRFIDGTNTWGLKSMAGRSLGVAFADYNNVGRDSFTSANDETPGDLMLNSGRSFKNVGEASGTAYSATGNVHGGMGTDWGDYDNDQQLDKFVATFQREAKAVYHNEGAGFSEKSAQLGLTSARPYVSFGAKWLDFDNDGWLDLMISNGHISDNVAEYEKDTTYRQPTLLYHNQKGRQLADVSAQMSQGARKNIVGRGLATGDYDNDGRIDALVVDSEGAPLLLHNQSPPTNRWISIKLQGTKSNRSAIGAMVTVTAEGGNGSGLKQLRRCGTDGSYLSASDPRILVGLGQALSATVEIRWPSGKRARFEGLRHNHFLTINESKGIVGYKAYSRA